MDTSKELCPPEDGGEEGSDLAALTPNPHTCRAELHLGTSAAHREPGCLPAELDFALSVKWKQGTGKATELKMRKELHLVCSVFTVLGTREGRASYPLSELLLPPPQPAALWASARQGGTLHTTGLGAAELLFLSSLAPKVLPLVCQFLHKAVPLFSEQLFVPIPNESYCSLVNKNLISSTSMRLFLFIPFPYQYLKAHCPMLNSFPFSLPAAFSVFFFLPFLSIVCPLPGLSMPIKSTVDLLSPLLPWIK